MNRVNEDSGLKPKKINRKFSSKEESKEELSSGDLSLNDSADIDNDMDVGAKVVRR